MRAMAPRRLIRWHIWASWLLFTLVTSKTSEAKTAHKPRQKRKLRQGLRRRNGDPRSLQNQRRRAQQDFVPLSFSWSADKASGNHYDGRTAGNSNHKNPPEREVDDENEGRIIGGRAAARGAYPFFVQWSRGCGGSLIHDDLVLSAAHCYSPNSKANTVWVGGIRTEQARERTIEEARVHPQYNKAGEAYDFVILRLNERIRGAIQPVVLNTYPVNYKTPLNGEPLTVVGYGVTDVFNGYGSPTLLEAQVNYISNCTYESAYEPGVVQEDIMFCAGVPKGQIDSCQGDSGGPILDAQKRQIGVVSFGRGCGESHYPGVYARVSAVSNWIENLKCLSVANPPLDCVEITIDVNYDGYPSENGWGLYDVDANMIYQVKAGEVDTPGHVVTKLSLRPGVYEFYMQDKIGDGICCVYGDGFVTVNTGTEKVEAAGDFGYQTSLWFTVHTPWNPAPLQQWVNGHAIRYTVALRLTINFDNFPQEVSWQLMNDNDGQIIDESMKGYNTDSGLMERQYFHLSAGYYWFWINDSSSDGICCRSGDGYVQIDQLDSWGKVIKHKHYIPGAFGDFAEVTFEMISPDDDRWESQSDDSADESPSVDQAVVAAPVFMVMAP